MSNSKLIYSPRKFNEKPSVKVVDIYGAREGNVPTGKLIEKPAAYSIKPNELKKFRGDVADYLLKKYGFLQEIQPTGVDKVLKEMEEKPNKCQLCDKAFKEKIALAGHMKSHKLSEEAQKILDEIPEAKPDAYVVGVEQSRSGRIEFINPELAEGIPATSSDNPGHKGAVDGHGVEWYGSGLQSERKSMGPVHKGGTPGMRSVKPAASL